MIETQNAITNPADFDKKIDLLYRKTEEINNKLQNEPPKLISYTINALSPDPEGKMIPYEHTGFIMISKIVAVFVGATEQSNVIYFNLDNGFNYTYICESAADAKDIVERFMIALKANKGHRQELIGKLRTETF